jgi:uncharacterized protein
MTENNFSSPLVQRFNSLDFTRGIVILGILLMNITDFGMPSIYSGSPFGVKELGEGNYRYWTIINSLFDSKMRGVFCLLFGIGLILLNEKIKREQLSVLVLYRRMLWLIVFGLIDIFVLLWDGDILLSYGLCGLILIPFRNLKAIYLFILGIIFMSLYIYNDSQDGIYYKELKAKYQHYTPTNPKEIESDSYTDWCDYKKAWSPYSEETRKEIKQIAKENIKPKQGNYASVFKANLGSWEMITDLEYHLEGFEQLALMFFGMAFFKWGWLTSIDKKKVRKVAFLLTAFGVGICTYTTLIRPFTLDDVYILLESNFYVRMIIYVSGIFICSIGYLFLFNWLGNHFSKSKIIKLFESVGKMAFTNYLMQSVLCALIFYGFGFGLFGKLERYQLIFVVLFVWGINILFSFLWLKRFQMGPMEWIWRILTYQKRIKLRTNKLNQAQ